MPRRLITLGSDGKLLLKDADGKSHTIELGGRSVLLVVDTSRSMEGYKIEQAREGAIDFAFSLACKGYHIGLVEFNSQARFVCEPTTDTAMLAIRTRALEARGSTDMAAALELANYNGDLAAVVVVTDGQPNDLGGVLQAADKLKARCVEILTIGTDDADGDFLAQLASRPDLSTKVNASNLRMTIAPTTITRLEQRKSSSR